MTNGLSIKITPTYHLRFNEEQVLQQWWGIAHFTPEESAELGNPGEWRNVPKVKQLHSEE